MNYSRQTVLNDVLNDSFKWPMSDETYQSYRFFFMVYVVVWDIITATYSIVYTIGRYHLVFLTNWAYHLIAVYGVVAAFSSRHFARTTASGSRSSLDVDNSKEGNRHLGSFSSF